MYINFWYPVVESKKLGNDPAQIKMLGQDFVVFRDTEGTAHCLSNTCTHRGGSLSGGKVNGDRIQCPYHGWEFDGSGQCQRIPSLGPNPNIPGRTRIDAYPVQEKYGMIFAFLGDLPEEERPPMMEIPEFDSPEWRPTWINFQVPVNYERSIENGLDPAHNEFVHPNHGFSGANSEYKVNDLRWIEDQGWGPGFYHRFNSPASSGGKWGEMKKAKSDREAGSGTFGPNHLWTYIRYGEGREMHQYLYECPIDETETNIWLINLRNSFLEPEMDDEVNRRNYEVVMQDVAVLTDVHPKITPSTNNKEFMLPPDQPLLKYREKLKEFEQMGWRIDTRTLAKAGSTVAYAIPSPERRKTKGWVIDSIPLMQSSEPARKARATGT
jgi:phenylpropionate dioxygenase-like ring-hydroxylating dioxygenase large terminal subunit